MQTALTKMIDLHEDEKVKLGVLHTPAEIFNQVDLWHDTYTRFNEKLNNIKSFLKNFQKQRRAVVILTGAGTSEFIGYCVEGLIRKNLGLPVNVFSTTRIVTNPSDVLIPGCSTLLISFARSGNSPESVGAVKIASMVSGSVFHIVITCNGNGNLYRTAGEMPHSLVLLLSKKTNDRGLAMTSSFSNMVVAGQMLASAFRFPGYAACIERIIEGGKNMLNTAPEIIEEISSLDFDRAVFLGDGSNLGTAVESHLKLQELTSGKVMCAFDTFPGLRHGPEAVINKRTVVVAYLSGNKYVRKYETDLLKEIREKGLGRAVVVCCDREADNISDISDFRIEYDPDGELKLEEDLTPPVFIIAGQLLGLFKSLQLGCKPDSPSESDIISRVVRGVKVYDPTVFNDTGNFEIITES